LANPAGSPPPAPSTAFKLFKLGGIKYKISGVFLWNVVSWDVQGIHPASSSGEGTFRDDVISGWIKEHNAAVAVEGGRKATEGGRKAEAGGRKASTGKVA
jgi:hypothetical protein